MELQTLTPHIRYLPHDPQRDRPMLAWASKASGIPWPSMPDTRPTMCRSFTPH